MTIVFRSAFALAAFLLLSPLQSAQAADEQIQIMIDGIGVAKCSDITADFKTQPAPVVNALAQWAYGYITRRNVERGIAGKPQIDLPANGVTPEKLVGTILGVCEQSPESIVFEVVEIFYRALLKKNNYTS